MVEAFRYRRRGVRAFVFALALGFLALGAGGRAGTVVLYDMDPANTSPDGTYRWLDVADQLYSYSYRTGYDYAWATVIVDYTSISPVLTGTLTAVNLKPNFAYQIKLLGAAETPSNEPIGLTGRWWEQVWLGSAWSSGANLNNKGDGSSPNPNDLVYFSRRDVADATSPTGKHYRYSAYLVLGYFVTDALGSAAVSFAADGSYHVLWKTTQRARQSSDGPLVTASFDVDPALHPAYDTNYGSQTVSIYGEWERLPVGGVTLPEGIYSCQMMLTEESFHGSGGAYAGNWAAAMGGDMQFVIAPPGSLLLSVESGPGDGIAISGSPAGTTPYLAVPGPGTTVSLTAPSSALVGGVPHTFLYWEKNGVVQLDGQTGLTFTMQAHTTALALYEQTHHAADYWPAAGLPGPGNRQQDFVIDIHELLRVIQLYNAGALHVDASSEDGYAPGPGAAGRPHSADYWPASGAPGPGNRAADWKIDFRELLRVIQLYNSGAYHVDEATEDGFAPGPAGGAA